MTDTARHGDNSQAPPLSWRGICMGLGPNPQGRKSQSADSGRCRACAACVLQVNAVVYVGDGRSRDVIRAFEFPGASSNRSRPYGFEAIITTYELVLKVRPCTGLVLHEAARRAGASGVLCTASAVASIPVPQPAAGQAKARTML